MGFTSAQAVKALRATNGDVARALDWIFSHADQLDVDDASTGNECEPATTAGDRGLGCRDGPESEFIKSFTLSHAMGNHVLRHCSQPR